MNAIAWHGTHALLWLISAVAIWLLLDFARQFNKSPDCFSTRWEVGLAAAPLVYRPQKVLRHPHLKWAILGAFRWAATRAMAADHLLFLVLTINTSAGMYRAGRWQAGNSPPALTQATEVAMAQAEYITTAIRELMSRGRPPKSTSPVRLAHTELVAALAGNVPHLIYAD